MEWDEERSRALRELAYYFLYKSHKGDGGLTLTELTRELGFIQKPARNAKGPPEVDRAAYAALRRYLFGHTRAIRNEAILEKLASTVIAWLKKEQGKKRGEAAGSHFVQLAESQAWFDINVARRSGADATEARDASRAEVVADMMRNAFEASEQQFMRAAELLTGSGRCAGEVPAASDRKGFLMYRYATDTGNVVRTFTLVTPPSKRYPFCWFQNYYSYERMDFTRECCGVVVDLNNTIYMFGPLGRGDGVKMIVLRNVARKASIYSGLISTLSDTGVPLMSRVVLERTPATSLRALGKLKPTVLEYPASEIKNAQIRRRLRNHIQFKIGTEILDKEKNEYITADQMRVMVGDQYRSRLSLDGKPFNPADHIHYPFNQALMCFDPTTEKS